MLTTTNEALRELVHRAFGAIEAPGSADPATLVEPSYRNWEADGPAAELRGPAAFTATVEALDGAFSELRFEVLATAVEDDLVAARVVMHGVHSGTLRTLPATGRRFAQSQSHWFRVVDGRLAEHWANRDDLGFLHQIGVAPTARIGAGGPR